jgi:hypothetical protein
MHASNHIRCRSPNFSTLVTDRSMDLFSMRVESTGDSGAVPFYSAKDAVGRFFNDGGVFADRSVGVKGVFLCCCLHAISEARSIKKDRWIKILRFHERNDRQV